MPQSTRSDIPSSTPTGEPAVLPPLAPRFTPDPFQKATVENPVHILLCTNSLYLQHAAVCLTSLLANNPTLFFDIVIVGRITEALDEDKLRRSLAHFPNNILSFRKFTPPADLLLPLNPRAHYTLDNWTRLWVSEFFTYDVERVLYLDSDIVVVGSISPLWHTNLEGALFGAVDIPGSDRGITHLGLRPEDGYFNSGVLLIDLKQWRETRALETVLTYVVAHPELLTRDVDQEALNACFHGRRKRLDYRWNAISGFFRGPTSLPLQDDDIESVQRDARIIHYNGSLKPWSYFCDHPRKAEYERFLAITEWRDFVPADRTLINRLRKFFSLMLPQNVKRMLKALVPLFSNSGFKLADKPDR